jgi:hypothetical protein
MKRLLSSGLINVEALACSVVASGDSATDSLVSRSIEKLTESSFLSSFRLFSLACYNSTAFSFSEISDSSSAQFDSFDIKGLTERFLGRNARFDLNSATAD